jgi:hypothetical protein
MTIIVKVVLASLLIVILAACTGEPEPVYSPDISVIATREAEEYQTAQQRASVAWWIGAALAIGGVGILLVFLWQLRGAHYRVAAAKAEEAEAAARRANIVSLGDGHFYDMRTGEAFHIDGSRARPQVSPPPVVISGLGSAQQAQQYSLRSFVLDAVAAAEDGWDSKIFPHWRKFASDDILMTAELWVRMTDELVEIGLLNPKMQGRATTVYGGNDLRWMYDQLRDDA